MSTKIDMTKLSPSRNSALATVNASGATEASPLRLHGHAFRAGIWLYENNLLGMNSSGFYPLVAP